MEERLSPEKRTRQVGLIDLFMLIGFTMPPIATMAEVKHSCGGPLAYFVALPIGIALSIVIAAAEWRLGKVIWLRFKKDSKGVQNAVGMFLFLLQLFWIFVGFVSGTKAGEFVVQHLAR